ncbi:MAG: DUF58 domain-containing protein [Clostridiales bacterium]|nr:DUF58 domain-containing protein [Clostridiales bacterium]
MQIMVFLIILGILVIVELFYYRKHALDNVDLDVHFSRPVAHYNEIIEVIEIAQNNKKLPLPFMLLKFETPTVLEFQDMTNTSVSDLLYREDMLTMKPFSRHTRTIKARCCRRGFFSFARVNVSTADLLLMERMTKEYPTDCTLTILPEKVSAQALKTLLSITFSDVMQRRTLLTDPFSFAGIREYQPWDPMRSINWTATAKAGDFMVNQNTSTSMKQVSVFLNLEFYNIKNSTSLLEKSISLAYSFISELVKAGIPTALYANGRDIVTQAPVISNTNCDQGNILERGIALARIDLSQKVIPFPEFLDENSRRNADEYIVVISPKHDSDFIPAIRNLRRRCSSLLWVMPVYKSSGKVEIPSDIASYFHRWEVLGHD